MAGDWVKMRVWMAKDPKVIAMADLLAGSKDFREWLGCDCVTRRVTVGVTVTALLQVWGLASGRGKASGDDLRLPCLGLDAIDAIADVPGFGEAMAAVGWAAPLDGGGVVLPEFFRHNGDPGQKKRNNAAERKRRERVRKQSEPHAPSRPVTPCHTMSRDASVTSCDESVTCHNGGDDSEASFEVFPGEIDQVAERDQSVTECDIRVTGAATGCDAMGDSPPLPPLPSPPVNPSLPFPPVPTPEKETHGGFTGGGDKRQGELSSDFSAPKKSKTKPTRWDGTLPPNLDVPEFRDAWQRWEDDRKERHKALTCEARRLGLKKCAAWGVAGAIASIEASIVGGYQGLFDPPAARNGSGNGNGKHVPTTRELLGDLADVSGRFA